MRYSFCIAITLLALSAASVRAQEVQGLVLPVEHAAVSSPVLQEIIEAVLVKEGAEVKKGDILVQLRNAKELLAVEEAKQIIEQTGFIAKGTSTLYTEKMGSREQALKAQTELELSKLRLALAEEQLQEKTIRAPLSGIVVKRFKEPGEAVDRVEKLIEIVNIDQVYVQFYLDPKFMQILKTGEEVKVRFPVLGNVEFQGKIDFVAPQIDASSNLFLVKLIIDNPDHTIKAGMRGMADFGKPGK